MNCVTARASTSEARACGAFKKLVLLVAGLAMQRYGHRRCELEQEVLSFSADILIDTYSSESAGPARARLRRRASFRMRNSTSMRHRVAVNEAAWPHRARGTKRTRGDG
jgi:hypothetical protein